MMIKPLPLRLICFVALWAGPILLAQDPPPESQPVAQEHEAVQSQSEDGAATKSALIVYLDPRTGRLVNERPEGVEALRLSEREAESISRSGEGLVVQTAPDGSVMVNLKGRFQHMATAVIGPDGNVTIGEVNALPTRDGQDCQGDEGGGDE